MKITWLKVVVLIIPLVLGCAANKDREIIDRAGRTVKIGSSINRVISTAPSNTEIIADLGMAHKLVAIDRYSVNVAETLSRLSTLDFFYPDAEAIISLEPDLIIASGHNATGTGEDPFRPLEEAGIPVVYISMSRSIEDIYKDIAFIADLLWVQKKGEEVIETMKAQIAAITGRTANVSTKRTVYFEISAAPDMMSFGKDSFINDMISAINARNIFENDNWLVMPGAESIIERNPDVILTSVNYIDDPIGEIKSRDGFNHITAVKENRIYLIDNDSSSRPSTRVILALKQMSQAVYPEFNE
jgi:iron complex transport system substrate-binding protein